MSLFRPEVLRAQDRLHDDVMLVPPVSWRLVGGFLAVSALVASLYLAAFRYEQTVAIPGRVTAPLEAELDLPAAASLAAGAPVRLAAGDASFEAEVVSVTGETALVRLAAPLPPGTPLTARIPVSRSLAGWLFR